MFLAKATFGRCGENSKLQLEDLIQKYLARLLHQGQLCSDYFFAWNNGILDAYVHLAAANAHALRHHSDYGKETLRELKKAFGKFPQWTLLDDHAGRKSSSWRKAPFLFLESNAFDDWPPVRRGDNGQRIPSYSIPLSYRERESIYFWQDKYNDLDNIWLGCGTLEIPAYRQLADPNSELSEHGRDLCKDIEKATGIPTYYCLMRYWGRRKGEDARKCPGCGRAWRTKHKSEKPGNFWVFAFQCHRCRLLSHFADSFDDERHAAIGEYRKKKN